MQRNHHGHVVDFRTPQHPSAGGTNSWGGASPLLARDIPKESLDQRYTRLNSIRTHDNPIQLGLAVQLEEKEKKHDIPKKTFLSQLMMMRPTGAAAAAAKEKPPPATATLGGSGKKKKRWFPRWDSQNRWPQGWC